MASLPLILIGIGIAIVISGWLNTMALSDELAVSLGTKVLATRILGVLAITLLAGTATALTGGLAFVGLLVPHLVRWFTGPDQRWIIPASAFAAPVIVLVADVLGRILGSPGNLAMPARLDRPARLGRPAKLPVPTPVPLPAWILATAA